jgi:putative zinc finger protein
MRNLEDQGERIHRRTWELLPWYANGSLAERERESVEAHLAVCPRCEEEAGTCRRTAEVVHGASEVAPSPHPVQLQRVLARIDEHEHQERSHAGWWKLGTPLRELLEATPATLRGALAAQAAVIAVLVGVLVWQGLRVRPEAAPATPAVYRTLSDAAAPGPAVGLRVMFAPQASEREIRGLLLDVRGQITAGPSPLGVYTVGVPAAGDPIAEVLARLRSEPHVAFAEPAAGGEAGKGDR